MFVRYNSGWLEEKNQTIPGEASKVFTIELRQRGILGLTVSKYVLYLKRRQAARHGHNQKTTIL